MSKGWLLPWKEFGLEINYRILIPFMDTTSKTSNTGTKVLKTQLVLTWGKKGSNFLKNSTSSSKLLDVEEFGANIYFSHYFAFLLTLPI